MHWLHCIPLLLKYKHFIRTLWTAGILTHVVTVYSYAILMHDPKCVTFKTTQPLYLRKVASYGSSLIKYLSGNARCLDLCVPAFRVLRRDIPDCPETSLVERFLFIYSTPQKVLLYFNQRKRFFFIRV